MNEFTVVICTYKRHAIIGKCLINILKNSILPKKIIIVDQNHNSLSLQKIKKIFNNYNYKNFIILKNIINKGLTKSKNISLKYCSTKYIFFIDDDIFLENYYFYKCLDLISKKKALGVCGIISNFQNNLIKNFIYYLFNFNIFRDNRYYFINHMKLKKYKSYSKVFQLPGGITCFDKKIFNKISFDEKYLTHNYEDVEFNLRLRKNFNQSNLFIHLNAKATDGLEKNAKENLFLRVYFMRLLYLRNKKFIFFILFNLSFLGLLISNFFNLGFNDYKKIGKSLESAKKRC
jgi:GT2 family glycosyltransferase